MDISQSLTKAFENLSSEAREFYLSTEVPHIDAPPTPLKFYREWVAPNRPVIIRNAINHWPALKLWNSQYLKKCIGEKTTTVAVTPNGYADAIVGDRFVMPEERLMKFGHFLDILEKRVEANGVFYVQKQNSNFTDEFSEIISDAETELPWASEAFGNTPDAVNFWMGDERAITSMHKDPYENLYCVISGYKKFNLIPPTDLPFIPYGLYKPSKYKSTNDYEFEIADIVENSELGDDESAQLVPWISVDPLEPDLTRFPDFAKARPLSCTVQAGEMLYLPSLWFHHVQQSHACIAVNFWIVSGLEVAR
ncbi:bifunctional peptidase and (3S)-lysyl hydroxylase Jmjd7 [Nematostella vectensis]|uniref:bifunctional peptidase and (3S)-lysyl hydroxylase Jmjd7 n=1 Tax=Nematostella vectensis TaxID=45351 RepID=UPI00207704B4|nr:bifunctional peptidase and (3S)-lysyl hydroxylase Jmjd7 [Nematostella vectensis]